MLTTEALTKELIERDGIEVIKIDPYEVMQIKTGQTTRKVIGPAIVLINQD